MTSLGFYCTYYESPLIDPFQIYVPATAIVITSFTNFWLSRSSVPANRYPVDRGTQPIDREKSQPIVFFAR